MYTTSIRKVILSQTFTYLALILLLSQPVALVAEDRTPAFFVNWKLLKQKDKEQFLSGYLQAWADARETLAVVEEFIGDNPQKARQSVAKIRRIYDFQTVRPDSLAREVDAFYENSDNHTKPLSVAVTAARARLR